MHAVYVANLANMQAICECRDTTAACKMEPMLCTSIWLLTVYKHNMMRFPHMLFYRWHMGEPHYIC